MPDLDAAMTSEEVAAVDAATRRRVPAPEMRVLLRYLAPAIDFRARVDMLAGLRAVTPPETFETFRAIAQQALTAAEYRAVEAALGLR